MILGPLGRDGMGVVYKAFDPELDRPIALKLVGLARLGSAAEQAGARLQREARTLARLSHPGRTVLTDALEKEFVNRATAIVEGLPSLSGRRSGRTRLVRRLRRWRRRGRGSGPSLCS